jgi:hypothetical protein
LYQIAGREGTGSGRGEEAGEAQAAVLDCPLRPGTLTRFLVPTQSVGTREEIRVRDEGPIHPSSFILHPSSFILHPFVHRPDITAK